MFRAMQVSNTNYYINASTGSNSNNGLSPSSAWQTLQYGHDFVHNNIDLAGYQAVFNCTGNFTAGVESCGPWIGQTEPYNVLFQFTSGSSVITSGASCFMIHTFSGLAINGPVTLSSTPGGANPESGYAIDCKSCARCVLETGITFGQCTVAHIRTGWGGIVHITNSYTIAAGASSHYFSQGSSMILTSIAQGDIPFPPPSTPFTITVTGNPTFTQAFATVTDGGQLNVSSTIASFSGTASGLRYLANLNGVIDTLGGGGTFFPGSSASGTTNTGGQYT